MISAKDSSNTAATASLMTPVLGTKATSPRGARWTKSPSMRSLPGMVGMLGRLGVVGSSGLTGGVTELLV